VDLVDEKDRLTTELKSLLSFVDHFANSCNAFGNRREGYEFAVRVLGDQSAEGGLARAGWSPEDHRFDVAGFDGRSQGLSGCEQVLLPNKFFEGARAHPRGEGLGGFSGAEEGFSATAKVGRGLTEFLWHWCS